MFTNKEIINTSDVQTAWNVPTLDLKKELQNKKENFNGKPYTIFNKKYVFRSAKEIAELLQFTPDIIPRNIAKYLVTYKPERLALHALIVASSIKIKLEDEEQLQVFVNNACKVLNDNEQYQELIKDAYSERQKIEEKVKKTVLKLKKGELGDGLDNEQKFIKKWHDNLTDKGNTLGLGQYSPKYNLTHAIVAKATDEIYNQTVKFKIDNFINEVVDTAIKNSKELAITLPQPNERLTVMIAGGQASGKSGALKIAEASLKDINKNLINFVKINTDSYKPLLLEPGTVNSLIYSQLTQPEASLIHGQIQEQIQALVDQNKAPDVYIDQVYLGKDKLNMSLDGKGVAAIVVSTKVEDAIERSFKRGFQLKNNQGRFEHTNGVLGGHKGVATAFIEDIFEYVGKNIEILILDNNVDFGKPLIKVMEINLKNYEAIIYDVERLKAFLKKTTINPEASNKGSVYNSDSLEKTAEKYQQFITKLSQKGIQVQYDNNSLLEKNITLTLFGKPSTQQSVSKQEVSIEEQKSSIPKLGNTTEE